MSLFAKKAAPAEPVATPKRARKLKPVDSPEYVTREHFDRVVDSLLDLVMEAARSPASGGMRRETIEYRLDRHADSPIGKRALAALARVKKLDERVEIERARGASWL